MIGLKSTPLFVVTLKQSCWGVLKVSFSFRSRHEGMQLE